MTHRQTGLPTQWLVADKKLGDELWRAVRALPRGSGILLVNLELSTGKRARLLMKLRRIARSRSLLVLDESAGDAARVHGPKEVRRAGTARLPLLFLSPLFPTTSHPDWEPLSQMRAAALARLAKSPVIALGGMNERRFKRIEPLGFSGWAGIDAWRRA
jgi:thiamine-phosphate pyrophosphorylase